MIFVFFLRNLFSLTRAFVVQSLRMSTIVSLVIVHDLFVGLHPICSDRFWPSGPIIFSKHSNYFVNVLGNPDAGDS